MDAAHDDNAGMNRPQGYWRVPDLFPDLPGSTLERLEFFYSELIRFNQKLNLISRKSELEADITHFADCIIGGRIFLSATNAKTIFDIGSGNGLPGLILALLDEKRAYSFIDSDERKTEFLKFMVGRIGLKNVVVIRGRFENLEEDTIQCAVSRGFASITKTLLLARRCVAVGGEYFHFKGSNWVREVADVPSQICAYWAPRLVKEYDLPQVHGRMAIVATKRIG